MSESLTPNEMQQLFQGPVRVAGHLVKPWTLKKFGQVYPVLKVIVAKLLAAGLTWDNLENFLQERALEVLPELLPEIPPLLAATLEIDLADAEEMDWAASAALVLAIFSQNLAPLKNLSALIPQAAPRVRETAGAASS